MSVVSIGIPRAAILVPGGTEPEWPSWGYHWVCTTVCNLHVFAVVQICGVLCFEAGACDLIRGYEDNGHGPHVDTSLSLSSV